ncbi:MAG: terminase family protein [Yoonia sp.]|nr:terminase family protein [Yoonia sp.]
MISGATLIASAPRSSQKAFLKTLNDEALAALPYLFDFWAMPHQIAPADDWRSWVILGGRGAGKTRAGAEWVRSIVEGATPSAAGAKCRIGLIAETYEQAREIMVFGESGILAVSPPEQRPKWIAGRRMLEWPNGATAQIFSAHDPDSLRGPQFDAVWVDEFAKWRKAEDAWDMIQFCLRLGDKPQACITTTPRNNAALRALLNRPSTVKTHAPTAANRANLADDFLEEIEARYVGTRLGRQEMDGELLTDVAGALWSFSQLSALQIEVAPPLDRIIVAIDPPITGRKGSDDCGIVICGVTMKGAPQDWQVTVLEDATMSAASPNAWAKAAIAAMDRHGADRLVAEVNQGGEMVETILRQESPLVSFRAVHAVKGKVLRAEPIAALYEQGRVKHLRGLASLEDQMCQMTIGGYEGRGSPDRVDALVWAIHDLMIEPAKHWRNPRMRHL